MGERKPIVRTLTAREREARAAQWLIRFEGDGVRGELEKLAAQEGRCCEWMRLDLRDEGAALVLTISAEP
jgi:hypothetical protein